MTPEEDPYPYVRTLMLYRTGRYPQYLDEVIRLTAVFRAGYLFANGRDLEMNLDELIDLIIATMVRPS